MPSPEHSSIPSGAPTTRFAPRSFLPSLVVLVACLAVSVAGWRYADNLTTRLASERFENRATEIGHAIEDRVATYEISLRGGLALLSSVEKINRNLWRDYVGKLNLLQTYPGIQGLGYALVVPPEHLQKHVAAIRSEGFPDYSIRPPGKRAIYTSIIYLEPFDLRNQRAFGFDMFSEPTRRAAMERSRDTGQTSITGRVTLVQETTEGVQAGFLMYLPFYTPGAPVFSDIDRRAALRGYVYSPFRMNNFMQGIVGKSISDLGLEVHDGRDRSEQNLMYRSQAHAADAASARKPMFASTRSLTIFGRTWTLGFRSLPGFEANLDRTMPLLVLGGGVCISLLLFLIVLSLMSNRQRALALADAMTVELRESEEKIRLLLESTGEPIYGIDTSGLCTFCNPACVRVLGYRSADEMLGKNMHTLIHHTRKDGSPFDVRDCRIFQAFQDGQGSHVDDEVFWRADGTSIQAEYWSYPQRRDGEIVGAVVTFQDITERRRNAALLAAERQRLAYILEGTNVGTWEWNVQTGETVFNERWAQVIGFTLEELAPLSIETWLMFAHPDDLQKSAGLLERHFSGELGYYDIECRMKHKNGGWVWVHDRGKVATWTDDGKPLVMCGTHQDITERKLAEADSAKLAGLVNSASQVSIIATDTDGLITVFNHGAENMLGYSADEMVGLHTPELIHLGSEVMAYGADLSDRLGRPLEGFDIFVALAREGGYDVREWTYIHKAGRHIPVELVVTAIRDQHDVIIGFLGIGVDISARVQAKKSLQQSERRFRDLADLSPVGIFETDAEGNCLFVNKRWQEFAGLSLSQAVDQGWLGAIHPDDMSTVLSEWLEAMQRNRDFALEFRFQTPEGKATWLMGSATAYRDAAGEVLGYFGTVVDIGKRIKAENALRHSKARLTAVLENAVDPIFTVGQFGHIRTANTAACDTFGYSLSELVGQNVKMLMPEPYHSQHDGYLARYASSGVPHIIGKGGREVRGKRKDGVIIPLELAVSEIVTAGERLYTGILRDITDRVQAREAMQAANAELEARQKLLDADMEAAAEIQRSLLPKEGTCSLGIETDFRFMPSATIGGDIFNVICLGAQHTALYMIDVSGHGVPAALVSVTLAQEMSPSGDLLMDKFLGQPRAPEAVLRLLDSAFPLERFDKFFSMFYLLYEAENGTLTYCNAGHPPPMLLRAAGGVEYLDVGGTLVGMGMGHTYVPGQIQVQEGDMLLAYTDGVSELESPDGEQFGVELLESLFAASGGQTQEQVLQMLTGKLQAHADGRPPDDDISLVCARFSRI